METRKTPTLDGRSFSDGLEEDTAMSTRTIAGTVSAAFRLLRQQANAGKERFGDKVPWLARRLQEALLRELLMLLKKTDTPATAADDAAFWAKASSLEAAKSILDTSSQWLDEGREVNSVFGEDRAAMIGMDQEARCAGAAKTFNAKARGKKLKWRCGPKACEDCCSLNGKTIKPGGSFHAKSGKTVQHHPLHLNCDCKVEEV